MTQRSPIDREYQRKLLLEMRAAYPRWLGVFTTPEPFANALAANLLYLQGHGLVAGADFGRFMQFNSWTVSLTARGLDFLEDDGGLTAILGVVTIKLHADTVRELIAAKIDEADAPPAEKSALKEHLSKLPGTILQAATGELVKQGLAHMANPMPALRALLAGP